MNRQSQQNTKLWSIAGFDRLDVFRAEALHYSYARHSHSSYSIGLIEAGVGGNYYQGATYLAPPQSVVLMNPEEVHTGYSAEGLPLTYHMLYPSVLLIEQIAGELESNSLPYFKIPVIRNQALVKELAALHQVLETSEDKLQKESQLIEVFSLILLHCARIKTRSPQQQEHQAIALIKEYLHDQYSANISLEQLAELTDLNRSYLIRVFRKAVGMPPYTYLNQVRVEKAKKLLSRGMPIAETAIAVGMADQSHLNRHFRRIVGVTPGQYRQSHFQE